jgi:hypothetical protein
MARKPQSRPLRWCRHSSAHRPNAEPETAREAADVELEPDPTAPDVARETTAVPAEDRALATAALSMLLSTLCPCPRARTGAEIQAAKSRDVAAMDGGYGNHVRTHANQGGR